MMQRSDSRAQCTVLSVNFEASDTCMVCWNGHVRTQITSDAVGLASTL